MDRLSQLRGEAGGSQDSTLDTTSPPSETFMTANESSSKYYSLSEVDSTFDISSIKDDISSIKDVSLASTAAESDGTITNTDDLISNLSPIGKKSDILDSYKIDTQIEAANILSGGVAIFDDNDNSYDGHELVIDDNVEVDDKSNSEMKQAESLQFKPDENMIESSLISEEADIASKDTEVVLQIDGKHVDAIDIGNGLYLYRKAGQEELAAVQISDDDQQQPSFKFLKVRENTEGNLEVYEEIEIEIPKEVPAKDGKTADMNTSSHVPIMDINKVISESASNKVAERKVIAPRKEAVVNVTEVEPENKESSPENKAEVNLNGKMMKFSESRKSPVIGSFTPMTYHSTPNKEGKPLTKTMVDQQLHPSRHSDLSNVKKTIEVHTDTSKPKSTESPIQNKDAEDNKFTELANTGKENVIDELNEKDDLIEDRKTEIDAVKEGNDADPDIKEVKKADEISVDHKVITEDIPESSDKTLIPEDTDIEPSEKVPEEKSVEEKQTDLKGDKVDGGPKIVDDVKPEDKIEIEKVVDFTILKKNQTSNEAKVEEVVQLTSDEGKDEPMDIDDETVLTIAEPIASVEDTKEVVEDSKEVVEDSKETLEDSNKNQKDVEKANLIKNPLEKPEHVPIEEPILIEDDDVSIVEEVVVESRDEKEKSEENVLDDKTIERKLEDESIETPVEIHLIDNEDNDSIEENKDVTDNVTMVVVPSTIAVSVSQLRTNNDLNSAVVAEEVTKDTTYTNSSTEKELKIDNVSISLPVGNPAVKDAVSAGPAKTLSLPLKDAVLALSADGSNKVFATEVISQDSTKILVISPSKEPKSTSQPVTMSLDQQIIKPIEPSAVKGNKPKEHTTAKHDIPSNISSLLNQKPQSLIAPKTTEEKPIEEKVEAKKSLSTVRNVKTTTEKSIGKQTCSKKQPVKPIPIIAQLRDSSVPIPTANAKFVVTDKVVPEVLNLEIPKKNIPLTVTSVTVDKPLFTSDTKRPLTSRKDERKDTKFPAKDTASEKGMGVINMEITKVPKIGTAKANVVTKQDVSSTSTKITIQPIKNKIESKEKREAPRIMDAKPINNNHAAVPFGKWTEANRQEFLNKFKTKASVTPSNSNQLKNSNDLNRRDVLKKIDSQRQSSNALSKTQEANKLSVKPETAAFSNKPNIINKETVQDTKIPQKIESVEAKPNPVAPKATTKIEGPSKPQNNSSLAPTGTNTTKKEACQRTGVVQNLIDKTIEGMIHRNVTSVPKSQDEPKQSGNKEQPVQKPANPQQTYPIEQATLDAIEMKMNELHGIPFIERPAHELPQVNKTDTKTYSKNEKEKPQVAQPKTKIPNLLPFANKNQPKMAKETVIEVDSEDEIIEHEPITGDIDFNKKNQQVKLPAKEKLPSNYIPQEKPISDSAKKDAIITEKDFDKFARRNSITYENRLTVNFDGKEPHNVVQMVVAKDSISKSYTKNEAIRIDNKAKLPYKYQNVRPNTQPAKVHAANKYAPVNDDANRNQSKLQKAYHSALTAKRQLAAECPISIIEDKPVKVVFIDNADYVPSQLNVQGQDLSPVKRSVPEMDVAYSACDSLDSEMLETIDDGKLQDDTKIKTKHQRKQVLTPVDEPELELIEPKDLGIEVSPKKKRKTEDDRADKNLKYPMRKKFYMLSSSAVTEDKITNPVEIMKNPLKETVNLSDNVAHKNPVSAIDSLVKAAELIETQTENINNSLVSNTDDQPSTPVKRGRGRPRKYPLTPDGTVDKSKVTTPSPQKRPRLIDAKIPKRDTLSDDSDSEGEIIKENWTMGKINENIVCPICNKLFRTENVVFKHVKHCTGPSPSRSDSDKRSPRRMRISQDFDSKSRDSKSDDMDMDDDKPLITRKESPKKRKSKDSVTKSDEKDDVIIIEDTPPVKVKSEKMDERKHHESRNPRSKIPHKSNDLVCEFCGKTFRQLSYLVSHKLQHKKQDKNEPKKLEKDTTISNKSVYSCEVCKKEFRKLHHLVQHRIIHNPSSVPVRSLRKSSSEQTDNKIDKEPSTSKQSDDPSAGFRCEPCDKSFRKLHHLVEHRETHDGINRQKITTAPPTKEEKSVEKPPMVHQCDVCKKTFRKLQHLNEHKEQHVETSSDKSDDMKSVKSSLSTKDIIHECSLCYMVFPNEHSLNKHTIICQRKKRQSKQLKPSDDAEGSDELTGSPPPEEKQECIITPKPIFDKSNKYEEIRDVVEKEELAKDKPAPKDIENPKEISEEPAKVPERENNTQNVETKVSQQQVPPTKRDFVKTETVALKAIPEVPEKIKKVEEKETVKIHDTPKKKTPQKDKTAAKRLKTLAVTAPVTEDVKSAVPAVESSDDDEIRYMLNPNFKADDVTKEKVFMKVRAKKRSSLQIERPNSKDLVKRRTSLQHPPKIPRLKPKAVETHTTTVKKEMKTPKLEPVPSTDSDDSETTKYSFPSTIPEKPTKPAQDRTPNNSERKIQKKSLADKRKSLSGIAKRKSLGKVVTARHKATPLKQIKKRLDAEHRCDCGQLFSSAALLSRHTTLAHTPPRIRRRRSPPPEEKPVIKPAPRKSSVAEKLKKSPVSRKSSVRSDTSSSTNTKLAKREVKPGRKSQVKDVPSESKSKDSPSDSRKAKPEKSEAKSSVIPRRTGAHPGVPVPEKMKKLMQKK